MSAACALTWLEESQLLTLAALAAFPQSFARAWHPHWGCQLSWLCAGEGVGEAQKHLCGDLTQCSAVC